MKKSRYSDEQIVRILREEDRDAVLILAIRRQREAGYWGEGED